MKIAIGVAVAIMLLWMGGHPGLAVMIALLTVGAILLSMNSFNIVECGCDHGKIWSPFGKRFKWCKRCDGRGVRKSFSSRDN